MKTIYILILSLFSFQALALDLNLYGLSYHTDKEESKDYNELNLGLGLRQDFKETSRGIWFAEGGVYHDSKENWAKYAGVGYQFKIGDYLRAGGLLGVAHSKSYNEGRVFVAPIPIVSLDFGKLKLHSTFIPKSIAEKGGNVFAIYLGLTLSK